MFSFCSCTAPAALQTIPDGSARCVPSKIAKAYFQRDISSNYFTGNSIIQEASWTGLTAATDDTKIVVSPNLEVVEFAEPDFRTDSENFDGAEILTASNPVSVTHTIRNPSKEQYDALRQLGCEDALMVYFVDANNNFFVREVSSGTHAGFPISPNTFGAKAPFRGGELGDNFKTMVQYALSSAWYADAVQLTPETGFFPRTEIVAP